MVKKNKTMIVAALAIVLTLAVGYALFSQTINITGTATAQGDFQITPTCSVGVMNNSGLDTASTMVSTYNTAVGLTGDNAFPDVEKGYNTDSCTITDNNTGSFTTKLEYPGAMRLFTVKLTNTGSIAATISSSDFNTSGSNRLKVPNVEQIALYHHSVNAFTLSTDEAIESKISEPLLPGESMYMIFEAYWPSDGTEGCNGTDDSCTVSKEFSFTYHQAQ